MAKQVIFLGTVANDGTGTPLRDAMDIVNDNFTEVYDDIADIKNGITFTGDIIVPDEAYGIGWDSSLEVPTKNAVYDAIEGILDGCTFTGDIIVPAEAYGVGWNGSNEAPTKNDVYDKIEDILDGCTFTGDIVVPDEAYGVGWNGSLEVPTKNAVYDQIQSLVSATALPPNYQDVKVNYVSTTQIQILAGSRVRDEANTTNVLFASNYTIDMTDSTPDSTQGGRSVAEAANTLYYLYVGLDGSNNPIAWLDTANLFAGGSPTNPASYSSGRKQVKISIYNDASSNISPFVYSNNARIDYREWTAIYTTASLGGTPVTVDASAVIPSFARVGLFLAYHTSLASISYLQVRAETTGTAYRVAEANAGASLDQQEYSISLNTSQQHSINALTNASATTIHCKGYIIQ
jgi:hypothetical protein